MTKTTKKTRRRQMTRREFVGGAVAAAGMVTGAPALLRGRNLNDKLNIAFIACGGRANASLNELTITPGRDGATNGGRSRSGSEAASSAPHPDENVVVLCDVNQNARGSARPSGTRRPRSSPISDASSTTRTTSTPSWSRRPSTRTRSRRTWR